jgi:hypothetical protein
MVVGSGNVHQGGIIGHETGTLGTGTLGTGTLGTGPLGTGTLGVETISTGALPTTMTGGTYVSNVVTQPLTTTTHTTGVIAPTHTTGINTGVVQQGGVIEPGQRIGFSDNVLPTHTVIGNTSGQGEFIFRFLEGKFISDKDPVGKMDPYCKVKLGWHSGKTGVAKSQGTNPTWTDTIVLPRKHNETFAKIKVKDKDRLTLNDRIGEVKVNLDEIVSRGKVTQWYPVSKKEKPAGEILLDIEYSAIFMR